MKSEPKVTRWMDRPPGGTEAEDEAAELLRRLGPSPALSPAAERRLAARLAEGERPARKQTWRWVMVAGTVAAAGACLFLLFRPAREAPACVEGGACAVEIALVGGVGSAQVDAATPRRMRVTNGRLAVRTRQAPAVVDAPRARITVRAASTVEVRVVDSRVSVAAFAGSASVEWLDTGVIELVAPGTRMTPDGVSAVDRANAAEVERALAGAADGKLAAAAPAPASVAPAVPAPAGSAPAIAAPAAPAPAIVEPPPAAAEPVSPAGKVSATKRERHHGSHPVRATSKTRAAQAPVAAPPPVSSEPVSMPVSAPAPVSAPLPVAVAPPVPSAAPPVAPAPPSSSVGAVATLPPAMTSRSPAAREAVTSTPVQLPAPAAPAESALAAESRLVGRAVRLLRQTGDPDAALAALAEYRSRFPRGALATEAEVARLDALLFAGRRAEGLHVLDGLGLRGLPRRRELTVLRGELRAESGRCAEAIRDFNDAAAGTDALAERALYGRGACHARRDDESAARADLERYLSTFPRGTFADAARRALGR